MPYCGLVDVTCGFPDSLLKYLSTATFGTKIAFQMSVLESIGKVTFSKNPFFAHKSIIGHPV